MTALVAAVSYGDEKFVKRFLDSQLPVNVRDPATGRTALFFAVLSDNLRIARLLLRYGADPNVDEDIPILHVAVCKRSRRMVDLLAHYRANLNRRMALTGKTALYMAVELNQTEIARRLLFYGADVQMSEYYGRTLLHLALKNSNEALARCIAEYTPCQRIDSVDYGHTALHIAIQRGYISVVKELIRKGANLNEMTFLYTDPLMLAVMHRNADMVKLLVSNGARMNMTVHGLALHYAVFQKYKDMVTLLLDIGVAHITDYNKDGLTALHVAVLSNDLDMARLCIKYGADVNMNCRINNLPSLYYATSKGNRRMVKLLLDNGANYNEWMCDCSTLLDNAIIWENEAISRMFIEKGAEINLVRTDDEEGTKMAIKLLAQLTFRNPKMLKIAKTNLTEVQKTIKWRDYFDVCLQELSKMRTSKLLNHITFHDLMSPDCNKIAAYGRNENFEKEFLTSDYKKKFPIYSTVLTLKYTQARVRGALLMEAVEAFENLEEFGLPFVCAQKVLEYLENDELKNFLKGVCDCKDKHTCEIDITITF